MTYKNYDRETYLNSFKEIMKLKPQVEKYIDDAFEKGVDNLVMAGVGGSISIMMPMEYFAKKLQKNHWLSFTANPELQKKPLRRQSTAEKKGFRPLESAEMRKRRYRNCSHIRSSAVREMNFPVTETI